MTKKYGGLLQGMHESSMSVVRCTVGLTHGFKVPELCILTID